MTPTLLSVMFMVQILPSIGHRFITDPYQEQQFDSVIVSSDSITITEKKENNSTPVKPNEILKPQKRSYEDCSENDFSCLYGNDKNNNRIVDKFLEQYSNPIEWKDKKNLTDKENFRKLHWTIIDSQTQHQIHDDTKGWVTLDPIPWSTSKISKWHPNKVVSQHEIYDSNAQLPIKQFWVSNSNFQEQKPTSQWGIGGNDIITDNKPSNFPNELNHEHGNLNQHKLQGINYSQQENLYSSQGNFNNYHHSQPLKGVQFTHMQNTHPSTYPNNGNGEWVLLSATKGYSHPGRHRWAGMKNLNTELRSHSSRNFKPIEISRYHEENISDKLTVEGNSNANRKSDEMGNTTNSTNDENEKTLQILYTGSVKNEEPTMMTRRKVRLQVLPALENTSTLHGGLLEVDSTSQTIDEAHEEEKLKNLKTIAIVKKNKLRGYKLIPASKLTGKSSSHKNLITLAAVGAGMIPASMALLVPMALGRKKRSLPLPVFQPLNKIQVRRNLRND